MCAKLNSKWILNFPLRRKTRINEMYLSKYFLNTKLKSFNYFSKKLIVLKDTVFHNFKFNKT